MLDYKRGVLAAGLSLLAASQVNAAALKLDIVINGQPVENARVILNGEPIGSTIPAAGLWLEDIAGGSHRLELEHDGERFPIEFSVADSEAVFIALVREEGTSRPRTLVQHVALEDVIIDHSAGNIPRVTVRTGASDALVAGSIEGVLTTTDDGTPVRNATITVVDQDISTNSDRQGKFSLKLPQGSYSLRVEHPDHQSRLLNSVRVLPDLSLSISVDLDPQIADADSASDGTSTEMDEIVVVARYERNNPIDIERTSSAVVDSIDFAQNARFDDSMLSGAIKRVVGVTLEEDRFAIVRGMKSRYQSAYFDGVVLPSTDPSRRDLPLDIFPSGIMQGLSLQKSATADVPGSATAGHIDMSTKPVPEEPFFNISASQSYGDGHNDDAIGVKGGDRDRWGMDDGFRDMPADAVAVRNFYFNSQHANEAVTPEQIEAAGESFNHYGINKASPEADTSVSINGGRSWTVNSQRFGLIGALRYGNKWNNTEKTQYQFLLYTPRDDAGAPIPEAAYPVVRNGITTRDTDNVIDISGMLNLVWEPSDSHRLGLNNVVLRHTTNSAEIASNYRYSAGDRTIPPGPPKSWAWDEIAEVHTIDWIEEQLVSSQLWGEHYLSLPSAMSFDGYLGDLQIDWHAMTAAAEHDRPDAKKYTWSVATSNKDKSPYFRDGATNNYMLWENMEEDSTGYRLDLQLPVAEGRAVNGLIKAGLYAQERERNGFRYSWAYTKGAEELPMHARENPDPAQLFVPENIVGSVYDQGLLLSSGSIRPEEDFGIDRGSHYLVEQNSDAYYLLGDVDFWSRFRVNLGFRKESFDINADQYSYRPEPLFELLDEDRTLPSLGLTYYFNDAWQLRAGYSKTVSWPEVFEVLPRSFRNIETLTTFKGNPDLRPAEIKNYDMRLEWYPSSTESITFALFHKDVTDGIEDSFDGSGDDYTYYTFRNIESASVSGWEIDLRQEFSFGRNLDHGVFVQANYTDITSEVDLPENAREYDPSRPFQGQPDYIVNLLMGYDHIETGQELTLVFNRKGPELTIVNPAIGANLSNVYTEPYDDLKLIYRKTFRNGIELALSGENLLDSVKTEMYEREGVPYVSYEPGVRYKISAEYKF